MVHTEGQSCGTCVFLLKLRVEYVLLLLCKILKMVRIESVHDEIIILFIHNLLLYVENLAFSEAAAKKKKKSICNPGKLMF